MKKYNVRTKRGVQKVEADNAQPEQGFVRFVRGALDGGDTVALFNSAEVEQVWLPPGDATELRADLEDYCQREKDGVYPSWRREQGLPPDPMDEARAEVAKNVLAILGGKDASTLGPRA